MPSGRFKPAFSLKDVEQKSLSVEFERFGKLSLYTLRHRLFDGGWSDNLDREIYDSGDAVAVIPYNPTTDEVVLVNQFRLPAYHRSMQPWLFECIAGRIGPNERPHDTAVRESREEAGIDVCDLIKIADAFASPGVFAEFVHLYCARFEGTPGKSVHGVEEEAENIQSIVVSLDEAVEALDNGLIKAAPAQICLNWLARNKNKVHQMWS